MKTKYIVGRSVQIIFSDKTTIITKVIDYDITVGGAGSYKVLTVEQRSGLPTYPLRRWIKKVSVPTSELTLAPFGSWKVHEQDVWPGIDVKVKIL